MGKFDLSLFILTLLSIVFGAIWAAMLFIGIEPDGFKDVTISVVSILGTLITVRVINKKGDH